MIKKFFVTLIACSAVLVGCNNDDDSGVDKETKIPVEERNALDDEAIQQYMEDFHQTNRFVYICHYNILFYP